MGTSISRVHNGSIEPVDHLRNLEEVAEVKLEFDADTKLWALAVHPNAISAGGFEPILRFGLSDYQLESEIRESWLQVVHALTSASDANLDAIVSTLDATVPSDCNPVDLAKHWIPTPNRDTWESPTMVGQWTVERGYLRHCHGPIVLKCYGIAHQFFAPAGNFIPVTISNDAPTTAPALGTPKGDALLRAIWKGLFTLLKWIVTLGAVGGAIVGIGYVFVHYLSYFIAAILVFSFLLGPLISTADD